MCNESSYMCHSSIVVVVVVDVVVIVADDDDDDNVVVDVLLLPLICSQFITIWTILRYMCSEY